MRKRKEAIVLWSRYCWEGIGSDLMSLSWWKVMVEEKGEFDVLLQPKGQLLIRMGREIILLFIWYWTIAPFKKYKAIFSFFERWHAIFHRQYIHTLWILPKSVFNWFQKAYKLFLAHCIPCMVLCEIQVENRQNSINSQPSLNHNVYGSN